MPHPSRSARLAVAVLLGAVVGALTALWIAHITVPTDFEFWWRGAREWGAGGNPYLHARETAAWPLPDPLFYPLPALILTWPVSALPVSVAAGIFMGISTAALGWALMRDGFWRLLILVHPGMVMAMRYGQWSPLLMAGALIPSAAFVLVAKPTLGVACFSYRPTWRGAAVAAVFGLASLAMWPSWPIWWLRNLHQAVGHPPPIATLLGFVLVLSLLRWRRSDARFVFVMACVPQLLWFSDQLPLALIARNSREAVWLSICAAIAFLLWIVRFGAIGGAAAVIGAEPYVIVGCYFPALVMVLMRPNVAGAESELGARPMPVRTAR